MINRLVVLHVAASVILPLQVLRPERTRTLRFGRHDFVCINLIIHHYDFKILNRQIGTCVYPQFGTSLELQWAERPPVYYMLSFCSSRPCTDLHQRVKHWPALTYGLTTFSSGPQILIQVDSMDANAKSNLAASSIRTECNAPSIPCEPVFTSRSVMKNSYRD